MKKILFATTNEGKLKEAREILEIEVEGTPLEIEEIQSLDPVKVAERKAFDYFKELKKPLFVEDVSLVFNSLGKLPGTYINDFSKFLGNDGLIALLSGKKDRSAEAQTTIVFVDINAQMHTFIGIVKGKISQRPKGTEGFGWDPIFIPEGEIRTFGELKSEEKNNYSMRAIALKKFKKWLNNSNV